jgi:NAD-dependent dihydropyrimidine dehydrogenase PreA subunit
MLFSESKLPKNARGWICLVASIAYCGLMAFSLRAFPSSLGLYLIWFVAGVALTMAIGRSSVYLFEGSFPIIVWILLGGSHYPHPAVSYLPLAAMVLTVGVFESRSRTASILLLPLGAAWFSLASNCSVGGIGWYGWVTMTACTVQLAIVSRDGSRIMQAPYRIIDLVLCSYSGNTAHYAQAFAEGMKRANVEVRLHRFHYYPEFDASLDGDALVLAFPVVGWKPPWAVAAWMLFKMPRGRGRPAFILYSCAGGPENTSLSTWLLLRLRGWRPVGRAWAVYPNNIVTVRIGPRSLYRFLDRLVPFACDLRLAAEYGEKFARGIPSGQPHLIWPSPLFLIGPLTDNKYLNIFPYRNHARRRRCNGCGVCVRYCPVGRLTLRNGFPHAEGTCVLCFGCVNLCPTRSMNIVAWSEYGQPYAPKYPELIVRKKPD